MSDARDLLLPRAAWRLICVALVIGVSALMLMPVPPPSLDTGWDKLNHALAFAATALAGHAAGWTRPALRGWGLAITLLAWGAALEVLQGWLPPRAADPADWLADGVGVLIGTAAYALLARRTRRVSSLSGR